MVSRLLYLAQGPAETPENPHQSRLDHRVMTLPLDAMLAGTLGASDFARPAIVTIDGVTYPTTAIGVTRDIEVEVGDADGMVEVQARQQRVWTVEVASLKGARPRPRIDRISVDGAPSMMIVTCPENAPGQFEIAT